MERADLERLPPGKLIDLILAQQAVIEQLRARLAQPAKTPANSSVPPAHGYKPQRKPPADIPRYLPGSPELWAGHPGAGGLLA